LKNLDATLQEKLKETANQNLLATNSRGFSDEKVKIAEQETTIFNLTKELERLQESLLNADKEIDFNKEKNRALKKKLDEFLANQAKIVASVETDIARLERLIEGE
jgi:dynactin complex subunit